MLHFLRGSDLNQYPYLRQTMFQDRAKQFYARLRWNVDVDHLGFEQDEYDRPDAIYIIWKNLDGSHGGSARYLPTLKETMIYGHFSHIADLSSIDRKATWECTRFCVSPKANSAIPGYLMLGGAELMRRLSLKHFIGVFDRRMIPLYRRIGSSPVVLGSKGKEKSEIFVGLWTFTEASYNQLLKKTGIGQNNIEIWSSRLLSSQYIELDCAS